MAYETRHCSRAASDEPWSVMDARGRPAKFMMESIDRAANSGVDWNLAGALRVRIALIGNRWRLHDATEPAIVFENGTLVWMREGKLHRADGPAEIWPAEIGLGSGSITERLSWQINGVDFDPEVDKLLGQLAGGGLVPQLVPTSEAIPPAGIYELVGIDGRHVGSARSIASVGWITWLLENSDEYVPALAAAQRARAMHVAMASAPAASRTTRHVRNQARRRRSSAV